MTGTKIIYNSFTRAHKCLNVCAYTSMYLTIMRITRDIVTYKYVYKDIIKLTYLVAKNENEGVNLNNVNEMNED